MNKWLRIIKHRLFDERDAESERSHGGEIRVCVEAGLPLSYLWRDATARERALALFGKLRVWDTDGNNGVLIYLLLAEHQIEIVADRGLSQLMSAAQWRDLVDRMAQAFKAGQFETGLNAAIDEVDRLLARHFPLPEGAVNPNELPNAPVLR
jgi:uncharacterized membrane protein